MEPTKKDRVVTNITETVKKHEDIMTSILPAYGISGGDSVARYHGIGKATVLKTLKKKTFSGFEHFGKPEYSMEDVLSEATSFIGDCYDITAGADMSEKR